MQCQLARVGENPIHVKHATRYRDYRQRSVIYYTPWKCVSSPSDLCHCFRRPTDGRLRETIDGASDDRRGRSYLVLDGI